MSTVRAIWCFTAFLFFAPSVSAEPETKGRYVPTQFERAVDSAQITQRFQTFGELLRFYQASGALSANDVTEISKFLDEKGVALNSRIPAVKIATEKIAWGATEILKRPDGSIKNRHGLILKLEPTLDFKTAFYDAYGKVMAKTDARSLLESLLLSEAKAYDKPRVFEVAGGVSAAFSLAWDGFLNLGFTVVGCPFGAVMSVAGGYASAVRSILHPIRKWMDEGEIECTAGDGYRYKNLDLVLLDPVEMAKQGYQAGKDPNWYMMRLPAVCTSLMIYGGESVLGVFFPGTFPSSLAKYISGIPNDELSVPSTVLKEVFPGDTAPRCDKENAKKVKSALFAKAVKVEKDFTARISDVVAEARVVTARDTNSPGKTGDKKPAR